MCAMLFWAACAALYATGDVRAGGESALIGVVMLGCCAFAVPLSLWSKTRAAGVLLLAALAGGALGSASASFVHAQAEAFEELTGARVDAVLLEDSSNHGFGENALVQAEAEGGHSVVFEARLGDVGPLLAGEHVTGFATFKQVDFGEDGFSWRDGACGQLSLKAVEKAGRPAPFGPLLDFRARAIEAIGGDDDAHALLQALVCGYRRNVSGTEMYAQFQACGLAHLVAVSGAHLVIVTGLIASLLKRLRVPRRFSIGVLVAAMAAYFVIAGMPVSALRATVMSSLGLFSFFGSRRASSLTAVGIATFGLVVVSPSTCVSASFALSALSTVGIVLFGPLFQGWLERSFLARVPLIAESLALTLAASLLTQLYSASLFHQLPLVAPLANAVCGPLFPLVCGSGLFMGVVRAVLLAAGTPAGVIPVSLSGLLAGIVGVLCRIPCASVPFTIDSLLALALSASVAAGLWALWPKPDWKGLGKAAAALVPAVAIAAALVLATDREDAIIALDVGQGDAILVQSRGQRYLVDTGNQDSKLTEQLALNHVAHLDGVIVTHADDDHCGCLDVLERSVAVDRVILARDMLDCDGSSARDLVARAAKCAPEVVGVATGDGFRIGAFSSKVVWPHGFTEEGGNADSLCLLLEYDGDDDGAVDFRALLTGDAEKDELASMLDEGSIGDIDLLKVGHHGSRNGSTPDEMRALDPEVALVSCGANNRYGHPTQEILDQLESIGAAVFRTDLDGEVRCALSPDGINVSCLE